MVEIYRLKKKWVFKGVGHNVYHSDYLTDSYPAMMAIFSEWIMVKSFMRSLLVTVDLATCKNGKVVWTEVIHADVLG